MSSILEQFLRAAVNKQSARGTTNSARTVSNLIRTGKGLASLFGDDASELASLFGGGSELKSLLGGNTSVKSLLGADDDLGSLFGDDVSEIRSLLNGSKSLKSLLDGDDDDDDAVAATNAATAQTARPAYGSRPANGTRPMSGAAQTATGTAVSGYCKGCGAPIAGYANQNIRCEYCDTVQTLQKTEA